MDSREYPGGRGTLKERYVDGELVITNAAGAEIYRINPATRTMTFPAGATLTNNGTSYVVTVPDDVTLEVDGNDKLAVKDGGIGTTQLSAGVNALLDLLGDLPTENVAAPGIWNDNGVLKVGTAT